MGLRRTLTIAFALAAGAAGYYRFGTQETKTVTVNSIVEPDAKAGLDHYRVLTDGGNYNNENGWIALKFKHASDDMQEQIIAGEKYDITSYGWDMLGKNITAVKRIDKNAPPAATAPATSTTETGTGTGPATTTAPASTDPVYINGFQKQTEAPQPVAAGPRVIGEKAGGPYFALTPAEAALAKQFFGAHLNTDDVRLHFYKDDNAYDYGVKNTFTTRFDSIGTPIRTLNNQIIQIAVGNEIIQDYSLSKGLKASFLHWMTLVWQGQKGIDAEDPGKTPDKSGALFELKPNSRFVDFSADKQDDIILSYLQRFMLGYADASDYYTGAGNYSKDTTPESDKRLRKVVEDVFPGAATLTKPAKASQKNTPAP